MPWEVFWGLENRGFSTKPNEVSNPIVAGIFERKIVVVFPTKNGKPPRFFFGGGKKVQKTPKTPHDFLQMWGGSHALKRMFRGQAIKHVTDDLQEVPGFSFGVLHPLATDAWGRKTWVILTLGLRGF